MTWDNFEMLEKQKSINKAFGQMYFAIYLIDLKSDEYLEVSTLDIFREHIPPTSKSSLLFDMVLKHYVSEGYKDSMKAFLDLSTLQERLGEQNAVSNDFFGTTQGWCRASFVVGSRNDDGSVKSFVYATQEINQEVKNEREHMAELKKAYAAAETANRTKSDFLLKMSHDIRTPLNAVMGFGELISHCAKSPEKVREYADKIKMSGKLLLSLLGGVLDMAKLGEGSVYPKDAPFSMGELLGEFETVISVQATENGRSFEIDTAKLSHDRFVGDKSSVSRIVFDLTTHALNDTASGENVRLRAEEIELPDGHTEIVFVTNGAESSGDLPIAKSLAAIMGGEITSDQTRGTITARLPLKIEKHGAHRSAAAQKARDVLCGLNILVVEDNALNLEIIIELLKIHGAKCAAAQSGKEALDIIENLLPDKCDLIIMDVRMPDMDGYETTRRIRALGKSGAAKIPIIALTANAFTDDAKKAADAGMDAHLTKPLDIKQLEDTVAALGL